MANELPSIGSSAYTSSTIPLSTMVAAAPLIQQWGQADPDFVQEALRRIQQEGPVPWPQPAQEPQMAAPEVKIKRRLVQVFIADPDENVPLVDTLLYSGVQQLTDATDEELFYEVDIKTILAAHNAKRIKMVNKKVKERTEYLEPAKIRELRMVVVTVASF